MTDDQINQRIAKACGLQRGSWKEYASTAWEGSSGTIWTESGWTGPDGRVYDAIPNYTLVLNAMHEAEQWLFAHGLDRHHGVDAADYANMLYRTLRASGDLWLFASTARQRAEAF